MKLDPTKHILGSSLAMNETIEPSNSNSDITIGSPSSKDNQGQPKINNSNSTTATNAEVNSNAASHNQNSPMEIEEDTMAAPQNASNAFSSNLLSNINSNLGFLQAAPVELTQSNSATLPQQATNTASVATPAPQIMVYAFPIPGSNNFQFIPVVFSPYPLPNNLGISQLAPAMAPGQLLPNNLGAAQTAPTMVPGLHLPNNPGLAQLAPTMAPGQPLPNNFGIAQITASMAPGQPLPNNPGLAQLAPTMAQQTQEANSTANISLVDNNSNQSNSSSQNSSASKKRKLNQTSPAPKKHKIENLLEKESDLFKQQGSGYEFYPSKLLFLEAVEFLDHYTKSEHINKKPILTLNFPYCHREDKEITNTKVIEFAAILPRIPELKEINMEIFNFDSVGAKEIFKALKANLNLSSLKLNIRKHCHYKLWVKEVCELLETNKKLVELELGIKDNFSLDEKQKIKLFEIIKKGLENNRNGIAHENLTNNVINELEQAQDKSISTIKNKFFKKEDNGYICTFSAKKIIPSTALELLEAYNKTKAPNDLPIKSLHFIENSKSNVYVTVKDLEALEKILATMPELEKIEISNCQYSTYETFNTLIKALQKLTNLKELILKGNNPNAKAMEALIKYAKTNKKLLKCNLGGRLDPKDALKIELDKQLELNKNEQVQIIPSIEPENHEISENTKKQKINDVLKNEDKLLTQNGNDYKFNSFSFTTKEAINFLDEYTKIDASKRKNIKSIIFSNSLQEHVNNELGEKLAKILICIPELEVLTFSNHTFSMNGAIKIFQALKANQNLTELKLCLVKTLPNFEWLNNACELIKFNKKLVKCNFGIKDYIVLDKPQRKKIQDTLKLLLENNKNGITNDNNQTNLAEQLSEMRKNKKWDIEKDFLTNKGNSFDCNFNSYDISPPIALKLLDDSIDSKSLKLPIKSLSFTCSSHYGTLSFTSKNLYELAKILPKLPELEKLEIKGSEFTAKALNKLFEALKSNENLVELSIPTSKLADNSIDSVISLIEANKKLIKCELAKSSKLDSEKMKSFDEALTLNKEKPIESIDFPTSESEIIDAIVINSDGTESNKESAQLQGNSHLIVQAVENSEKNYASTNESEELTHIPGIENMDLTMTLSGETSN
jgi:hypothetical protein